MTLLDTNVVSELMRRTPEPAVVAWLDAQATRGRLRRDRERRRMEVNAYIEEQRLRFKDW